MVDGGGETPGPIPNPEAKPARADGTAPGREWESRLPPTQQLHTHPPHNTTVVRRVLCHVRDYAPPRPHRWTPHCGQPRRHPSLAHAYENPGRNHPAGRDLPTRATEVAGSAHAATMTPPVRRKSSTGRRVHPRTPMDSTSTTRPTTTPTKPEAGPDSALRTITPTPIIGAYP